MKMRSWWCPKVIRREDEWYLDIRRFECVSSGIDTGSRWSMGISPFESIVRLTGYLNYTFDCIWKTIRRQGKSKPSSLAVDAEWWMARRVLQRADFALFVGCRLIYAGYNLDIYLEQYPSKAFGRIIVEIKTKKEIVKKLNDKFLGVRSPKVVGHMWWSTRSGLRIRYKYNI